MNEKHIALLLLLLSLRLSNGCCCAASVSATVAAGICIRLTQFAVHSSPTGVHCAVSQASERTRGAQLLSLCHSLPLSPARLSHTAVAASHRIAAGALLLLLLSLRTRSFLFDFTPFWFRCVARNLNFSTIKVQKSTVFCMQQLLMAAISS